MGNTASAIIILGTVGTLLGVVLGLYAYLNPRPYTSIKSDPTHEKVPLKITVVLSEQDREAFKQLRNEVIRIRQLGEDHSRLLNQLAIQIEEQGSAEFTVKRNPLPRGHVAI